MKDKDGNDYKVKYMFRVDGHKHPKYPMGVVEVVADDYDDARRQADALDGWSLHMMGRA